MSGCDLGGAHEVAVSIQDINAFLQLPIAHQDHVADVGTGWRERGAGGRSQKGLQVLDKEQMQQARWGRCSFVVHLPVGLGRGLGAPGELGWRTREQPDSGFLPFWGVTLLVQASLA